MDFTITKVAFVLIWFYALNRSAVSGKYVGRIGCKRKLSNYDCRRESCTGECVDGCIDGGDIWGTAFYTYDSPICRSAIHDSRISTWNQSARTVTFRYHYDIEAYLASIRQDISTKVWGRLSNSNNGCFYFQSPRVKETLLDIISLHHNYLHDGKSHIQECHLSTNAINYGLFYSRYTRQENIEPKFCNPKGPYSCWRMQWNESDADEAGGYWCRPTKSMLSGVLSVAMRKDAEFLPDVFTITKSIKDRAVIEMRQTGSFNSVYWYKDGNGGTSLYPTQANYRSRLEFENIRIGHAGIYSSHYSNVKYSGKIRLIVRVCESEKYGPLCEYNCPDCQNGGVCHDITGDCICPPGFNGTYCENACQENFFGKNCKQQCLTTRGIPTTCNGIQFCLPDPYGCSCGSGYETIFCNKSCSNDFYGAGCTQSCSKNCKQSRCHFVTGRCISGCKDGWHGERCLTSYPVFIKPPVIINVTENSITIKFYEWNAISNNSGLGTPASYIVQYKETASKYGNWTQSDNLEANQTSISSEYIYTIKNLLPDIQYSIRVVIVDDDGGKQLNGIPEVNGQTTCGVPQQPVDIRVNSSLSRQVVVTWKLPPKETWRCMNVSTELSFNNSLQSLIDTSDSETFEFESDPYTEWHISLRTRTRDSHYSTWSLPKDIRTAEDAPSEVRNLTVESQSYYQILVTWKIPVKENGIIIQYIIEFKQLSWVHNCNLSVNSSVIQKKVEALKNSYVIDVSPSVKYEINVSALTVKKGTPSTVTIETQETIPGAPPKNLEAITQKKRLQLKWNAPRCDLFNGCIVGYQYFVQPQDPWDTMQHNGTTTSHEIIIQDLQPFTTYYAIVFAMTKVGMSNFSAQLSNTTLSDKPPAPRNVTVYHKTASIISLSWKPPSPPKGKLLKYKITYCISAHCSGSRSFEIPVIFAVCVDNIRKGFHCVAISQITANKEYTIKVNAFNEGIEEAGESVTIKAITEESVPDPPSNGKVINATESSFDVIWDAPLTTNGNITAYRVNVTAINSYNKSIMGTNFSEITGFNDKLCEFQDLYPATIYTITIEASTVAGFGKPLVLESSTQNAEPVVDIEPVLGEVTSTTAVLFIKPVEFTGGPISGYFIIVQYGNRRKKRMIPEFKPVNYSTSIENGFDYYTAAEFDPKEIYPNGTNFIVGDGKVYNGFYNAPLMPGERYKFGMAVLSDYNGEQRIGVKFLSQEVTVADPLKMEGSHLTGIIIGILIVLLLLTIAVIIIIAFRYPDLYQKMRKRANINSKFMLKDQELISMSKDTLTADIETEQISEPLSCYIAVSDLEDYVQKQILNGAVRQQFVSLGKGQCHPSEYSKTPENKLKNRYGNLLSYDHTRVILEKLPNDQYSDYINANYVDGYKKPKRYIATQGPKPITVSDFWRMIWQENVTKIIMSTNLVENGKTKCEKYWPDTSNIYGEIKVSLIHTEMYADYVIRTLNVKKGSFIREIVHFHFTTWPDHGVPMYAVAVGNFIQKFRSYKPDDESPTVVHCSAGVGRTGTLILIDSMLDMAAADGQVDLIAHLYIMRQQRINIVETLDQYYFVHYVLVEVLCREDTAILCSEYLDTLNKFKQVNPSTGQTAFHVQFEKLTALCPFLKSSDCRTGLELNNRPKNRIKDVIPPESARVILNVSQDGSEVPYINAVYVNGYRQKDSFIVTQIPLPETVVDFWRMAYYSKASTIVLINGLEPSDETSLPYWPESSEMYGEMQVQNVDFESYGELHIRTFEIQNMKLKEEKISKVIKQFHLTNWMPSDYLPPCSDMLLSLIEKVQRWEKQSGVTAIVQCLNGVRACGLFCASVFICDKIKAEQEIDVFLAVRSIRTNRPQFIENVEQYIYCHQLALTFLDTFETYANFQ